MRFLLASRIVIINRGTKCPDANPGIFNLREEWGMPIKNILQSLHTKTIKITVLAAFLVSALGAILSGVSVNAVTTQFTKDSKAEGTGSTSTVTEHGTVDHVIKYNNNDPGITSDLTLDDTATNQTFVGMPQGITGWDVTASTPSSFQLKAKAIPSGGKGLVFNTTAIAGTANGASGGGDGYVPLFADNGNVYWVFHHTNGTVQCASSVTGAICPGYPKAMAYTVGGQSRRIWSSSSNLQHIIIGNRLYSVGGLINGTLPTYDYGIGCFDLTTGTECPDNPFQVIGQFPASMYNASYSVTSAAEKLIGGKWYFTDYKQKVYCYDITVTPMVACGGAYPIDISDPTTFPALTTAHYENIVQEGTRLFSMHGYASGNNLALLNGVYVKCFDTATGSECSGWGTSGKQLGTGTTNVYSGFIRYTSSLVPDAYCSLAYASGTVGCISWADGSQIPDTANDVNGIPNTLYNRVRYSGSSGSVGNPGHRPGDHRTYFGAYSANVEFCWDWATNDACKVATQNAVNDLNSIDTAPGDGYFGDNGYLRHPTGADSRDYGARYQASTGCWWSIGDANLLWSFDDDGNVPCIPQSVRNKTTLNIASAYCSSGLPADAAWTVSKVQNFVSADWTKFVVEIKDPSGNVLLSYNAKTNATASLASINAQTTPQISYFVYASVAAGHTPFANAATTPLVSVEFSSANPIEFCTKTTANDYVCNAATNTIANLAELRIGAATTPVASSTTSMSLQPDPAGKCADLSLTQQAIDPSTGMPASSYIPGTNMNFQLDVSNISSNPGSNISVSTTYPAGITPTLASGDGWTCAINGQTVTCTRSALDPNTAAPPILVQTAIGATASANLSVAATVSSDASDPTPNNNTATTTLTADPQSDLTIAKRHDHTPVAGLPFQFSFDVTNNGPSDTASFIISDTLNNDLTFVPAGSSPECTAVGQVVTCTGGALASGATTTLSITVLVSVSHTGGGMIANSATVSGPNNDPTPGNNTSSDNVDPSAVADVRITKTLDTPMIPGQNATYTLQATNDGPSAAENVTVTDDLPVGLTFISVASPDWTCTQSGTSLSCLIGSILAPGAHSTAQLVVAVASSVSGGVENSASVSSTATDPNPTNNHATAAATVEISSDISLTKQLQGSALTLGEHADYLLIASNAGPSDATNVVVTDILPTGLTYSSFAGEGWTCAANGQTVTCSRMGLAANASADITLDVIVANQASGTIANTATVASDTSDPSVSNNTGSATSPVVAPATVPPTNPGTGSGDGSPIPTGANTVVNGQRSNGTLPSTGESLYQWAFLIFTVLGISAALWRMSLMRKLRT